MKPPVTPIFPRSNGAIVPEKLPIRKLETKNNILNSGGFNRGFENNMYDHPYHPMVVNNIQSPMNCITIAQHIESCPICSRLYDTDKTLYILAIIGLLILCFLMVRRIIKL